jgi:hypothetical protein
MAPRLRSLLFATLASGAAVLASAPRAGATLARAATFEEKVAGAESIVLGKCTATRSQWDADHRWIVTYSTFDVEKSLKGQSGPQLTLITPGGVVGDIHQDTIGIPAFREGDENVVFVRNTNVGPTVLFFDQGAYEVTKDSRGDRMVAPVPTEAVHVDLQRGMAVPDESPRTLQQFERDVHAAQITINNRMELVRQREQKQQQSSLRDVLLANKFLVALALAGVALATWQLLRR